MSLAEKYAARFGVSLVGFDWVEHFGPEGTSPIGLFSYMYERVIRRTPARELVEEPEITLGHLVKCANSGAWESSAQDRITSRSTRSRAKRARRVNGVVSTQRKIPCGS